MSSEVEVLAQALKGESPGNPDGHGDAVPVSPGISRRHGSKSSGALAGASAASWKGSQGSTVWAQPVWPDTRPSTAIPEGGQPEAADLAGEPGSKWSTCSGSRPGTGPWHLPGQSSRAQTPGALMSPQNIKGRLLPEEVRCFRRVPTPSTECDGKSDMYWQSVGELRKAYSESGLHCLPVLKGRFFTHPNFKELSPNASCKAKLSGRLSKQGFSADLRDRLDVLPDEALTTAVLNEIYPRNPARKDDRAAQVPGGPRGEELLRKVQKDGKKLGAGAPPPAQHAAKRHSTCSPTRRRFSLVVCEEPALLQAASGAAALGGGGGSGPTLPGTPHAGGHGHEPLHFGGAKHGGPGAAGQGGAGDGHGSSPRKRFESHWSVSGNLGSSAGGASASMGNSAGTAGAGGGFNGNSSVKLGGFSSGNLMLEFRKRLLDKFPTIKDAFESFTAEVPLSRDLTKKEWRRIMGKQGFEWSTKEERDRIFEHIDFVNNGHVSLSEFHIAVEAAAPVRNFEGLRRRWLASGYSSMAQAIRHMEENGAVTIRTRLNFYEFSELLKCVNVMEHGEHVSLFNAICSDRHGKTSLGELMSAIATVSPMLLLEDVRWRLLKKYDNDLEKAYFDLDMDHGGSIGWQEFVFQSVRRLSLTETEAKKVFKEIDIDSSGEISRSEFVSAIGLSEPSLFLEDLRLKIRQRFRSIEEAFSKAFRESLTDDLDAQPKIKLPRFQESLLALDLQEAETRTLFELVDADRDGELTVREFLKGVRHFAPSCVLEDLRVRCCQRHKHVCDAFAGVSDDRSTPLSPEAFSMMLESLDLLYPEERKEAPWLQESAGRLKVQAIFNLLDVNHEGTASLGRLVAALQSCGAGSNVRLPSEERDLSAKLAIRSDLAPVHRLAGDLKTQVRHGINLDGTGDAGDAAAFLPGGRIQEDCTIWSKYGANLIEKMLENPNTEAYSNSSYVRGTGREMRHWKYTKTPTAKPRRISSGASPRRMDGRASSRSNSPEHPHGQDNGRGRTVGLHGGYVGGDRRPSQKDDRMHNTTKNAVPPRLQTAPSKDFTKFAKPAPHAGRFPDGKKPVELCISGTQESWGNVWKHLHSSPWAQHHSKLERDLQVYYQAAASKMSHDMTLVQNIHSRAQLHQSLRQHRRGHTA